jgi:hypothetical protein
MQNSLLVRTVTAALFAVTLVPAAFAQSATRAEPAFNPYASAGKAAVCSQLELNAGITGDECGQLSLSEVAFIKSKKDNTN